MRRSLSTLLLLVLSWSMVAPLFAAAQGTGSNLPACCRRNGAHHCSMGAVQGDPTQARHIGAVSAKCPFYPGTTASFHADPGFTPAAQAIFAALVSHPASAAQTASLWRIARDRCRQKRGPPTA